MDQQLFVCGFMFSDFYESWDMPRMKTTRVALIEKRHGPECVIGKWNGIGGKIEPGETAHDAMARKFLEETGLRSSPRAWSLFSIHDNLRFRVFFFWNVLPVGVDCRAAVRTCSDETVDWYFCTDIEHAGIPLAPNVEWLLPTALHCKQINKPNFAMQFDDEDYEHTTFGAAPAAAIGGEA